MRVRGAVRELVGRFPGATWLTGGAIGTDMLVAEELLALGQRVELVLPFAPDVQSAPWTPDQRFRLSEHLERVAGVEIMRGDYHPAGYRERNMRLVERAHLLFAVWRGGVCGGTAFTVRAAMKQGVPIYWLPVP
jgi:hypothetical protein